MQPPRIVSFSEQEREIIELIKQLASKMDDEEKALLKIVLKKWGKFYMDSQR